MDTFYLDDRKYEKVLDIIYKNYDGSKYSNAINGIRGVYEIRFTKHIYVSKYQPLFVHVGYKYLCTIVQLYMENAPFKIKVRF